MLDIIALVILAFLTIFIIKSCSIFYYLNIRKQFANLNISLMIHEYYFEVNKFCSI